MVTLFSEVPLLAQWVPSIDKASILYINRISQIILLVTALLGIYPEQFSRISKVISNALHMIAIIVKLFIRAVGFTWRADGPTWGLDDRRYPTDELTKSITAITIQRNSWSLRFGF